MNKFRFARRRLVQVVWVLLGISFLVFFLIHLIPGDPATTVLGQHSTPERVAALHEKWGLDDPLPVQYARYLGRLVRGDLGESLFFQTTVLNLIGQRLPPTLLLLILSTIFSVLISVPLGVLAATKPESLRDHVVRAIPIVGLGMPPFWVGIMLVLFFSLRLGWFPVGGLGSGWTDYVRSMFLPSLTIAIAMSPLVIRSLRASILEVLESDYVVTARSKGLPERRIVVRHVLRNAVLPAITVLGVNLGFFIGGTVVIETVFALPGIGLLMTQSILSRDFPVVQGVTLVFGLMVVIVNLLTDLSYKALDPRVRLE
jgi:peptide/nickel transport system permease protein